MTIADGVFNCSFIDLAQLTNRRARVVIDIQHQMRWSRSISKTPGVCLQSLDLLSRSLRACMARPAATNTTALWPLGGVFSCWARDTCYALRSLLTCRDSVQFKCVKSISERSFGRRGYLQPSVRFYAAQKFNKLTVVRQGTVPSKLMISTKHPLCNRTVR